MGEVRKENELSDDELELASGGTSRYTVISASDDGEKDEPIISYRGRIMTLSEYNKLAGIE